MSWAAVAGAAVGVVGSAISADAAGGAADAQAAGGQLSIGEQRRQFDIAQKNQKPFLETGTNANRRLAYLLGLPGENVTTPSTFISGQSNDPVWEKILGDYNKEAPAFGLPLNRPWNTDAQTESIYNTLTDRYRAAVGEQAVRGGAQSSTDPEFGSLARRFSAEDIQADPVYQSGLQFGLDEGRKGINQRAAQMGNYDSGATLKALTRFGNDYGSTKANEAFNRRTAENTNIYNRLAGVSGAGQTAANAVNAAGANAANNISNLQTGIANSQAAGIVGGANAWGQGLQNLNSVYNNYQNRNILSSLFNNNQQGYNTDGRDY